MPQKSKHPKSHYLKNKFLLDQFIISKQNGDKPTEAFVQSWVLLVDRYLSKPNFSGYDRGMREEMRSEALLHLTRGWVKIDLSRSQNVFSYLTQIAHNAIISIIKSYKKSFRLRDKVLSYNGMMGSFSYQEQHNYHQGFWREEEHNAPSPVSCNP